MSAVTASDQAGAIDLKPLVCPRSIAIVGMSERAGSIGSAILGSLSQLGFDGDLWAVNPKYEQVQGVRCFPSLHELPAAPDLVAMVIRGPAIHEHLPSLRAVGARSMVIYDGGFAEKDASGRELQRQLSEFCLTERIALCGPNCMGILSPHDKSSSYKLPVLDPVRIKGNVGIISQSGSVSIGLIADVRRFGFSRVISSGNEAVVDASQYLEFLVDDPHTEIIALFLESARSPASLVAAMRRASNAGKPVVVLKVGKSERARRAVETHTGALAGDAGAFSAALRSANAIEVNDIDEMSEVLAAFQTRHRLKGSRVGVVTLSGGHTELLLDTAEATGVNLPPLEADDLAKISAVVGHVSGDGNPVDAWGNGDTKANFRHTVDVLCANPTYDALALCYDQNEEQPIATQGTAVDLFRESSENAKIPFYLLSTRSGMMRNDTVQRLAQNGIGILSGVRQSFNALKKLGDFEERRSKQPVQQVNGFKRSRGEQTPAGLLNEHESKELLKQFGLPIPPEEMVLTVEGALDAARRIGWPVVMKALSKEVPHKTEFGLVKLNVRNDQQVRDGWRELTEAFSQKAPRARLDGVLLQPMVSEGVEVFVGINKHPEWGAVLAFGLGGIFIEIIKDVAIRLVPLGVGDAEEMIGETRAAGILAGARGAPPSDVGALVKCLEAVSRFAEHYGGRLSGCDLNPIKVLPEGKGCVVLDALISFEK